MKRDPWHYGTWEGARDGMREDNLQRSLADKISILEDMERIAVAFNRQRHREGQPVDPKIASLVAAVVAEEQASYSPPSTSPPPAP